jgi:hypothetical protein
VPRGGEKQKTWLLFKATDGAACPGDASLLAKQPNSALTGRDVEAITAGKSRKSAHKKPTKKAEAKKGVPRSRQLEPARSVKTKREPAHAKQAPMPTKVEAELATLVREPPVVTVSSTR